MTPNINGQTDESSGKLNQTKNARYSLRNKKNSLGNLGMGERSRINKQINTYAGPPRGIPSATPYRLVGLEIAGLCERDTEKRRQSRTPARNVALVTVSPRSQRTGGATARFGEEPYTPIVATDSADLGIANNTSNSHQHPVPHDIHQKGTKRHGNPRKLTRSRPVSERPETTGIGHTQTRAGRPRSTTT
jgi:hypothetical protein